VRWYAARGCGAAEFCAARSAPKEIGGDWGYRRLTTYGGHVGTHNGRYSGRLRGGKGIHWLSGDVAVDRRLGSTDTTAQVHPGKFTTAMMRAAQALGAELRRGQVSGVVHQSDGARVRGVGVDDQLREGDAVALAMGPWTALATAWLPLPAVYGLKGRAQPRL
jgi:FAD dependent oxidoreductase